MAPFIRVTWIDVDDEEKRNLENDLKKVLGLACNLKELENGVHIQKKGTIDLNMNGQFDSHLYDVRYTTVVGVYKDGARNFLARPVFSKNAVRPVFPTNFLRKKWLKICRDHKNMLKSVIFLLD